MEVKKKNKGGRPRTYLPNPFMDSKGVERLMKSIITSKSSPIDFHDIGMELLQRVHGSRGLAKLILEDYRESQKGSPERLRFYSLVMGVLEKCWEKDRVGNVEGMTDEDIEAQINLQFSRLGLGRAENQEGLYGDGDGI